MHKHNLEVKVANPFDAIISGLELDPDEIKKQQAKLQEEYNKRDYLIHKVFSQTEDGQELLKNWVDTCLIRTPSFQKGDDNPYDIGMMEGIKTFVRNILLTCEKVEGD